VINVSWHNQLDKVKHQWHTEGGAQNVAFLVAKNQQGRGRLSSDRKNQLRGRRRGLAANATWTKPTTARRIQDGPLDTIAHLKNQGAHIVIQRVEF
jgi:hypothetical protein